MFKVSFLNSVLFLLIKYCVFFFILAFIGDRFRTTVLNNADTSLEMFKLTLGYILYVFLYSVFLIALFCAPLYFILKIKKGGYFLLAVIVLLVAEYFVYTYSTSQKYFQDINGIYNAIIGVVLLGVFFNKTIKYKFANNSK